MDSMNTAREVVSHHTNNVGLWIMDCNIGYHIVGGREFSRAQEVYQLVQKGHPDLVTWILDEWTNQLTNTDGRQYLPAELDRSARNTERLVLQIGARWQDVGEIQQPEVGDGLWLWGWFDIGEYSWNYGNVYVLVASIASERSALFEQRAEHVQNGFRNIQRSFGRCMLDAPIATSLEDK